VWHKLGRQIGVEREQLNRLIEVHRPLLVKCPSQPPNDIELSALVINCEATLRRLEAEVETFLQTEQRNAQS
jgi:hypothetical protein